MKKYISILVILIAGIALVVTSCEKDYTEDINRKIFVNQGQTFIKVIHVSPNFRAIQSFPDSFNIYVGTAKINGPLFTYNVFYPTTTINSNTYAAIPSGDQQIRFSLRGVNTVDSLTIISLQKTLTPGAYYTLFITDSIQTQQANTRIWVEDVFNKPDTSTYSLRFAHMILNDTAGKTVDVYSFRRASNIFTGITPGTVTPFTTVPWTPGFTLDTLSIRRTGTNQELVRMNGVSFTNNQRVYTLVFRGTSGTAGTKPRGGVLINNR